MFEWIASGLARFTTRRPWLAIIAVLAVAIGLSSLGRPEMSNDSAEFAPEDPAITASERIEALFGEESSVQPLQVVLVADVPHDLLEYVLEGDQARDSAVLVHRQRHSIVKGGQAQRQALAPFSRHAGCARQ